MKRLFSELQRRRVFQTAAFYIVGAWLVLQVADVVLPALDMPERSIRYVLFGAILGFPAVLVIGWFFDVGAKGISRTMPAKPEESHPLRKVDYAILAVLLAVTAAAIYGMVGRIADGPSGIRERPSDGPPMVAVLPFTAIGMAEDSEFFAVGVHDDLLTRLSQLESLRVISRTSVLEYKDTTENIRDIGAKLGADVILEGGVQSASGRIRINAQLIDAHTDEHLWANTFDRELTATNIFDVQSEIARAISAAMHTTLTPQDIDQLSNIPTDNLAAYREYLLAMEVRRTQRIWKNEALGEALEKAVELDPQFTRAMAELVGHLAFTNFFHMEKPEAIPQSEALLERLRELAPNSADHLIAKYYYTYYTLKDYPKAYEYITQAEQLRPSDMGLLRIKLYILRRLGLFDERVATVRKMQELDPLGPPRDWLVVWNLMLPHRYDEAKEVVNLSDEDGPALEYWEIILDLREHGDIGRWASAMAELYERSPDDWDPEDLWEVRVAIRDYDAAAALVPKIDSERSDIGAYTSMQEVHRLVTWWLTGNTEAISEYVPEAREFLSQSLDDFGEFINDGTNLEWALLAAVVGDREEAMRYVRRTMDTAAGDLTQLGAVIGDACRTLAMVGATEEAVDCLRTAFTEPTSVHPFLEPHFPFYDAIRDELEFIELLAEFE